MAVRERKKGKQGRAKTVYVATVWIGGIEVLNKSFDTRSAAHAWHDKKKKELLLRRTNPGLVYTLKNVVQKYHETAFKELRYSAQQSRESRFKYLLDAPIGEIVMDEITPATIDDWIKWLKAHPTSENKQRKSFFHELKLLTVILNWYRNEVDYHFHSPIVKRHHKTVYYKYVPMRQQDYYIPPEQVAAWLTALSKRPDPVYFHMALVMVHTGLRLGEAAGLCWDALEIDGQGPSRLRVIRTLSWDYRTKKPYFQDQAKNKGSIRTVAIGGVPLEVLKRLKKSLNPEKIDPVFLNLKGELLKDNSIRLNFNSAFKAVGLDWSGTHIARHTFATLALMSEGKIASVQAALGHQNEKITAKYAKAIAMQEAPLFQGVSSLIGFGKGEDSLSQGHSEGTALTTGASHPRGSGM